MKLLTQQQREQLLANGRTNQGRENPEDFKPVVKLYCPWSLAIWLLTELDPENPDIAFGLCDLGMGFPELGTVSLNELASVTRPDGLGIECDLHFTATKTLSAYAREAHPINEIVIYNEACEEVAGWESDELRLQLAAGELLDAARKVLARWEQGDLAEAVRELAAAVAKADAS